MPEYPETHDAPLSASKSTASTDPFHEEFELFHRHLVKHRLKRTAQRDLILRTFLETEAHLSVEELYDLVKQRDKTVGFTTVYRTLRLLVEARLAREVNFNDGRARYEHEYKHDHHDHLICTECDALIEFFSPDIERLQEEIAKQYGFVISDHSHRVFGMCQAYYTGSDAYPPYCRKRPGVGQEGKVR
ncbi:Fur family transcriptional regulator [Chloracidobacterium validum]|uniref:Fur family transcriptional regulator n=1 Tax=Chloracidobacterium validum TaxID=2821543 RepID=UPI001FE43062|nr:transcriptional repressor [Chloracidobacterium validum]